MRPEVKQAVTEWAALYLPKAEPQKQQTIVEIGSLDVNGNLREPFKGHVYVGVDMRPGDNVNLVLNAHDLRDHFPAGSVDAIICCDTFEHDDAFWLTLEEIYNVLRVGGLFICSVPSIAFTVYHPHPDDYWRFTEPAFFKLIMRPDRYELLDRRDIRTVGDVDTYAGIARKR